MNLVERLRRALCAAANGEPDAFDPFAATVALAGEGRHAESLEVARIAEGTLTPRDLYTQLLSAARPGEDVLPAVQRDRAAALAASHGHYWAAGPWWYAPDASAEGIVRAACAIDCIDDPDGHGVGGLFGPDVDYTLADPLHRAIVHRTGSGRVAWAVARDGAVHVRILRPVTGTCLALHVTADLQTVIIEDVTTETRDRHVDTAVYVLACAGCTPALCGAVQQALEDAREAVAFDAATEPHDTAWVEGVYPERQLVAMGY
jgi:hypothetical protein